MTTGAARKATGALVALLLKQRDLYRQLAALAERQSRLITSQTPERLLEVLAERQQVVESIQKTNNALEPFRNRWGAVCKLLDDEQKQIAGEAIAEISRLVRSILERDQRDGELLRIRCRQVADQLHTARVGRDMLRAYGADAGGQVEETVA